MLSIVLSVFFAMCSAQGVFNYPSFEKGNHAAVFRAWRKHFSKKYSTVAEEGHRFAIFLENWSYYYRTNKKNLGYTLGLNQFSDLNGEEFKAYIHGNSGSCLQKGSKKRKLSSSSSNGKINVPSSVDWTKEGKVTPVKNQGQCGSCWAFSTTGSIESRVAIKTGKLQSLSEQQLVDCSGSYGNNGCQGGLMDSAFKYVKANGGLCSEEEYPYTAANGRCKSSSCGTKYDAISSYVDVTHDSTSALEAAVAEGPVSIAIEADQASFQGYRGGVLTGSCGTRLDHGVLAVGYGSDSGQDFWKVKNSWGTSWGEEGYIRMCRNCNKNGGAGECGLMDEPSYPVAK